MRPLNMPNDLRVSYANNTLGASLTGILISFMWVYSSTRVFSWWPEIWLVFIQTVRNCLCSDDVLLLPLPQWSIHGKDICSFISTLTYWYLFLIWLNNPSGGLFVVRSYEYSMISKHWCLGWKGLLTQLVLLRKHMWVYKPHYYSDSCLSYTRSLFNHTPRSYGTTLTFAMATFLHSSSLIREPIASIILP